MDSATTDDPLEVDKLLVEQILRAMYRESIQRAFDGEDLRSERTCSIGDYRSCICSQRLLNLLCLSRASLDCSPENWAELAQLTNWSAMDLRWFVLYSSGQLHSAFDRLAGVGRLEN